MSALAPQMGLLIVRWPPVAPQPLFLLVMQYRPPLRRVRKAPASLRLPTTQLGLPIGTIPADLTRILEEDSLA